VRRKFLDATSSEGSPVVSCVRFDDWDGGRIRSGSFWTSTAFEDSNADSVAVSMLEVDEVLTANAR